MTLTISFHRRFMLLFLLCLVLLVSQGCMYTPYDQQEYASRSSTVFLNGFVGPGFNNAEVEIYVRAWDNPRACQGDPGHWKLLGTTQSASSPTMHDDDGNKWYQWHYEAVIPNENWCFGPKGIGQSGYSALVFSRYRHGRSGRSGLNNPWHENLTVEKDWVTCAEQQGGNGFRIGENCTRKGDYWYFVQIWAK